MAPIPQPLVVRLEPAASQKQEAPQWGPVTAYLRDTTKWIVGGIVATAGAVIAGSSLTNIGSLDPADDLGRLLIAVVGAFLGFIAIGLLFARALDVFYVPSVSLQKLAGATESSEWMALLKDAQADFPQLTGEGAKSLQQLMDDESDNDLLEHIEAMLPYLYVRAKFRRMVGWLPWTVFGAALGFGLFAWAANPPDKPTPPRARSPQVFVIPVSRPAS